MDLPFIKGQQLDQLFYQQAVAPLLNLHYPGLTYSAALLGPGSDVLGFDTPQSRDHDWGPRLQLFLAPADHAATAETLDQLLQRELPEQVAGYATRYVQQADGAFQHGVRIVTLSGFCHELTGNALAEGPDLLTWLTIPQQVLRCLTAGPVFHDGLETVTTLRSRLGYYSHDLWLYLLATQWMRISQEDAFVGRCAQAGDALGSRLVAARLVRDLMGLCFLMARQYAPYIKWVGTAFSQLDCAASLQPVLHCVLTADAFPERERCLSLAYQHLAVWHNHLGLTPPLPTSVSPFHDRPFQVIHADAFAAALQDAIVDPDVRALPPFVGSVDQWIDATDVLSQAERLRQLCVIYGLERANDAPLAQPV
jgi:hypothetical protein